MKNKLYLGIDTSNYTTSVALVDESGQVVFNFKKLLEVKAGERGLRQSDAVFQHIKNSHEAAEALREAMVKLDGEVCAVGVSSTPTYREGSYMPCFMAGMAEAEMIAASVNAPLYFFSHQAGHIMAALYSAGITEMRSREFAAFHVSGGTTDVISVRPDDERVIYPETVGGSLDINAGQAIDRAGVMMGLGFPTGREMEMLAADYNGKLPKTLCSVNGISCNLSGLENKAEKLFRETSSKEAVAAYVLASVRDTLKAMLDGIYEKYGELPIVFAGGVISCKMLRDTLAGANRYFAEPVYASDNACGTALLTYYKHNQ